LPERLQSEVDEAVVRCRQQEQVYRLHEKLHGEKLISDLEFIDKETKLALAHSVLTNKQVQARQAEARARDLEAQVEVQKEASICMPV
jgi:ribosome-binding ATPase YchF (GTP1/OBG family)